MQPDTHFASPERSSSLDVSLESKLLESEISFLDVIGVVSGITAILDENRQIVYANEEFLQLLGIDRIDSILGKRPGEAVACIHAGAMESGCGTSISCSVCGALNAIIESQNTGMKAVRETRITSESTDSIVSWDLKVTSSPVILRNKTFYIFTIEDISNHKRRQNLERIFFHDILNSAGNLNSLLLLLKEGTEAAQERELINITEEASRELIEEIMYHRQLRAAENGDLVLRPEELRAGEVLSKVVAKISGSDMAKGKNILVTDHSNNTVLRSDRILLHRILINLLKNALEATTENSSVSAAVESSESGIIFSVKNDFVMPAEVQMQVFQRSFSTKGIGRGIGTYSVRLLAERYLKGKVSFTSMENEGTIFRVNLPLDVIR